MFASDPTFKRVEDFARDVLRWATRARCDTRNSVLYVVGNCESAQLLCHKQCWRFFNSLQQHPRAASDVVLAIQKNTTVPAKHWGSSTIRWWPTVAQQYPAVVNTQPLYSAFRKAIVHDLTKSERLRQTGLTQLLCDIAQYSFASGPIAAPQHLFDILQQLVHPHHALVIIPAPDGKPRMYVHQWPSWLQQGSSRVVSMFFDMVYPPPPQRDVYGAQHACAQRGGQCALCGGQVQATWWHHILYECTGLLQAQDSPQWRAFVSLLQMGHQGLAIYTCFPLLAQLMPLLKQSFVAGTEC